jgi:hypothetical protein
VPADAACRWLASLPRLLFDLRHGQPDTSLLALRTLHDAARIAAPGACRPEAAVATTPALTLPPAQARPLRLRWRRLSPSWRLSSR